MKVKSSRGIAMRLICCTALVVFGTVFAFSQTPQSGALLSIDGTGTSSGVHLKIYDSQIHTGTVRTPAGNGSCSALLGSDDIPTDAYVLQGGAPTGCDPGDDFETNFGAGVTGTKTLGNFTITTNYPLVGHDQPEVCEYTGNSGGVCIGEANSSVDTGFLTVKNNGTDFTGTISLAGNSGADAGFCPPGNALLTDSFTGTLSAGASRTFALAADSSNCGGFNKAQHLILSNTSTSIAKFGNDDYQITPSNALAGDTQDVLPVPLPASLFVPGTNFSTLKCIPYADFSAATNAVCVELQVTPGGNSDSYIYTVQNDFTIDGNSHPSGVGGPALIGVHGQNCPPDSEDPFVLNFFLSYFGSAPGTDPPIKGSGSGGGSCWVAAFDPTLDPVPVGKTVGFVGFQSPVVDTSLNVVKAGSSVPLKWQQFKGDGTAETGLSWCKTGPTTPSGSTCMDSSPNPIVSAPWVFLGSIPVTCPNDTLNTATDTPTASLDPGKSAFQQPSPGSYQFNWQTVPKSTGCVAIVLQYDTGIQVFQAIFRYSKT